mmetsp:Transcript_27149/g.61861  ORF Transcript_27149/g.61861 Transcript_27149/m.61861 type:complete len:270 (-) Transcript_27149:63-872(-)
MWSAKLSVQKTFLQVDYLEDEVEDRRRSSSLPPLLAGRTSSDRARLIVGKYCVGSRDFDVSMRDMDEAKEAPGIELMDPATKWKENLDTSTPKSCSNTTCGGESCSPSHAWDSGVEDDVDATPFHYCSRSNTPMSALRFDAKSSEDLQILAYDIQDGWDDEEEEEEDESGMQEGGGGARRRGHRRARPRPCKQKRLRLKRLTAKLVEHSMRNPSFDLGNARLPPSLSDNPELSAKILRTVQAKLEENYVTPRPAAAAPSGHLCGWRYHQ